MSHAASEQPAPAPVASQHPLSAAEPRKHSLKPGGSIALTSWARPWNNIEIRCVAKAFPIPSIPGFWDFMVRGSAPIQMMKNALGESVVAREGKARAGLAGRDTAYAEEAADFGCLVGGGV